MLEDGVDRALIRRKKRNVLAIQKNLARARKLKTRDHAQGRGLSAAGRAENRNEFSPFDFQIKVIDDRRAVELLADVLQTNDCFLFITHKNPSQSFGSKKERCYSVKIPHLGLRFSTAK